MTTKDYIILLALIVILVILVKVMKASKEQASILDALATKAGIPKRAEPARNPAGAAGAGYDDDEEEGEEQEVARPQKKVKLKKSQRQTVGLFADGIPRQIGELRDMYMARFSDIDKIKFYNTLYNLKPSNTLNFEKIEGKNYWGLGEWFDEDGSLYEEYAEKIPTPENTTTLKTE